MPVTRIPRFTNAGVHFVYGFCEGNTLAAIREYQHRYLDRRQPYQRLCDRCIVIWEPGTLMTQALASLGRRNVRDEEDVLNTVHDNPSTTTRHISYATGRHSQLCVRISCVLSMYNHCKGWSRDISVYSCLHECYARLCTPLISVPWRVMKKSLCDVNLGRRVSI